MAAIAPSGRAPGVIIDQSLPIKRSPDRPDDSLLCRRCTELLSFDKQISMRPDCKWENRDKGEDSVLQFTWPVDDLQGLLASIMANSAQGCEFCEVVATRVTPDLRSEILGSASSCPDPTGCIEVRLVRRSTEPIRQVKVRIRGKQVGEFQQGSRNTKYPDMRFDVRAVLTDSTYRPYVRFQPEFDLHMGSSANLNFARECLNRCVESHADCASRNDLGCSQVASHQLLSQMRERPSRLLDLDRLHENSLQLCNTASIEDRYAALSYCWGTGARLVTTSQNIARLANGFSLDSLPATIADAITVTAYLGIRYLWVDSLCIIQDSDEDKQIELPKMADIYQNAHVTIIASAAKSAFSGFLAPMKHPEASVRVPTFDAEKGFVGSVILRRLARVKFIENSPDATETRAWCLQESILSTRCLVYSKPYLYWCCQELTYARRGLIAISQAELPLEMRRLKFTSRPHYVEGLPDVFRFGRHGAALTEEERMKADKAWRSIVAQFSYRGITDPMDKSRALAGLAKVFHAVTQDRYLAGMWESNLRNYLGWWVSRPKSSLTLPAFGVPLPAPSWSWLSAGPGNIILPIRKSSRGHGGPEIIHIDYYLTHPKEPFGHVASGKLQLRGRLAKFLLWNGSPSPIMDMYIGSIGTPVSERSVHNSAAMDRYYHDGTGKPWHSYRLGREAEVWALQFEVRLSGTHPPATGEVGIDFARASSNSSGVVLIPAPDSSSGTFLRVGCYSADDWNLDHVQPELLTII